MSKTGDTKKSILELLERKNQTLTDISNNLGLAPSTVSQHLKEMMDSGSIRLADGRPRKWKYYEINRGYQEPRGIEQRWYYAKRVGIPIAVIAIALIAGLALYSGVYANAQAGPLQQVYLSPGTSVPAGSTLFSVSDSPTLYNVSSLMVQINGAKIHSETTGKWYTIPLQKSSFDLIKLRDISTVLSGVKLNSGLYNIIVFNISNVTATVNGTTQQVFLPHGRLAIAGDFNLSNSSTNWINIDFNLQNSLHIMNNGRLVMLPVISVSHVNDSNLTLNQSSIIIARSPGRLKELFEFGMDQNGNMITNWSMPQNESLATSNGSLLVQGRGAFPMIIRGAHGLVIGGDASAFANITGNYINGSYNNSMAIRPGILLLKGCRKIPVEASANVSANNSTSEAMFKGCCYGIAAPLASGSGGLQQDQNGTNASLTIVASSAYALRCCFPAPVASRPSQDNVAMFRKCLQRPPVRRLMNSAINASELNNGTYEQAWYNQSSNSTMFNVSVRSVGGGGSAQCMIEDGGLFCNTNDHFNPRQIAAGIGGGFGPGPVVINGHGPTGQGSVGVTSYPNIPAANQSVNQSVNASAIGGVLPRVAGNALGISGQSGLRT